MKGWQKSVLFIVIAGVIGFVMYLGAKFFGFIGDQSGHTGQQG